MTKMALEKSERCTNDLITEKSLGTQVAALGLYTLTESMHLTIYNITYISILQTAII